MKQQTNESGPQPQVLPAFPSASTLNLSPSTFQQLTKAHQEAKEKIRKVTIRSDYHLCQHVFGRAQVMLSLRPLLVLPNLTHLTLQECLVKDGYEVLLTLRRLTHLDLSRAFDISNRLLSIVPRMASLRCLLLPAQASHAPRLNQTTAQGLHMCLPCMRHLRGLHLRCPDLEALGHDTLRHAQPCPTLHPLTVKGLVASLGQQLLELSLEGLAEPNWAAAREAGRPLALGGQALPQAAAPSSEAEGVERVGVLLMPPLSDPPSGSRAPELGKQPGADSLLLRAPYPSRCPSSKLLQPGSEAVNSSTLAIPTLGYERSRSTSTPQLLVQPPGPLSMALHSLTACTRLQHLALAPYVDLDWSYTPSASPGHPHSLAHLADLDPCDPGSALPELPQPYSLIGSPPDSTPLTSAPPAAQRQPSRAHLGLAVSDGLVVQLCVALRGLRCLQLCECWELGTEALDAIAGHLQALTRLDLTGSCCQLPAAELSRLQPLSALQHLGLGRWGQPGWRLPHTWRAAMAQQEAKEAEQALALELKCGVTHHMHTSDALVADYSRGQTGGLHQASLDEQVLIRLATKLGFQLEPLPSAGQHLAAPSATTGVPAPASEAEEAIDNYQDINTDEFLFQDVGSAYASWVGGASSERGSNQSDLGPLMAALGMASASQSSLATRPLPTPIPSPAPSTPQPAATHRLAECVCSSTTAGEGGSHPLVPSTTAALAPTPALPAQLHAASGVGKEAPTSHLRPPGLAPLHGPLHSQPAYRLDLIAFSQQSPAPHPLPTHMPQLHASAPMPLKTQPSEASLPCGPPPQAASVPACLPQQHKTLHVSKSSSGAAAVGVKQPDQLTSQPRGREADPTFQGFAAPADTTSLSPSSSLSALRSFAPHSRTSLNLQAFQPQPQRRPSSMEQWHITAIGNAIARQSIGDASSALSLSMLLNSRSTYSGRPSSSSQAGLAPAMATHFLLSPPASNPLAQQVDMWGPKTGSEGHPAGQGHGPCGPLLRTRPSNSAPLSTPPMAAQPLHPHPQTDRCTPITLPAAAAAGAAGPAQDELVRAAGSGNHSSTELSAAAAAYAKGPCGPLPLMDAGMQAMCRAPEAACGPLPQVPPTLTASQSPCPPTAACSASPQPADASQAAAACPLQPNSQPHGPATHAALSTALRRALARQHAAAASTRQLSGLNQQEQRRLQGAGQGAGVSSGGKAGQESWGEFAQAPREAQAEEEEEEGEEEGEAFQVAAALSTISANHPLLRRLELSGWRALSPAAFRRLVAGPAGRQLQQLELCGCHELQWAAIRALEGAPSLSTLGLAYTLPSPELLQALARLPALEVVDLAHVHLNWASSKAVRALQSVGVRVSGVANVDVSYGNLNLATARGSSCPLGGDLAQHSHLNKTNSEHVLTLQ
ncbi:hypothetical protein QJQ45_027470 [Haematococcus lacustris]|nr:hypothetical protein QJQ45_027470 [Haematococcus lacustris]